MTNVLKEISDDIIPEEEIQAIDAKMEKDFKEELDAAVKEITAELTEARSKIQKAKDEGLEEPVILTNRFAREEPFLEMFDAPPELPLELTPQQLQEREDIKRRKQEFLKGLDTFDLDELDFEP